MMMIQNVAVLVLCTSFFMSSSASASVKEFQETIVVGGTDERGKAEPPISPEIIAAIASNTTINECLRVYGFLLGHYKTAEQKMRATVHDLTAYGKKYAQKKLKATKLPTCYSMMNFWNSKMATSYDAYQAKRLFRLSLRSAKRTDLEMRMLELIGNQIEHELHEIETEIETHHKKKPKSWHNRKERRESKNSLSWVVQGFLMLVAILIPICLAVLIRYSFIGKNYSWKNTNNIKPENEEEGKPLVVV